MGFGSGTLGLRVGGLYGGGAAAVEVAVAGGLQLRARGLLGPLPVKTIVL